MPWGQPHPSCPGCGSLPTTIPQTHRCPELRGLLTTARTECLFCEVDKGLNSYEERPNPSAEYRGDQSSSRFPFNEPPTGRVAQSETGASSQSSLSFENAAEQIETPSRIDAEPTLHPSEQDLDSPSSTEAQLNGELARSQAMVEESKKESPLRLPTEFKDADASSDAGMDLKSEWGKIEESLKRLQSLGRSDQAIAAAIPQIRDEMMSTLSGAIRRLEAERQGRRDAEKARKDAVAKTHELQAIIRKTDEQLDSEISRIKADAQTALQDALAAANQAQKRVEIADARVLEIENRMRAAEDQFRKSESSVRQEAVQRVLAESRASELELEFSQKLSIMRTEYESELFRLNKENLEREQSLQLKAQHEIETLKTDAQSRLEAEITARRELEKFGKETEKRLQIELVSSRNEADTKLKASESRAADFAARAREFESRAQNTEAMLNDAMAKAAQAEQSYKSTVARIRSDAQMIVQRIEDETSQIKEVYKAEIKRIENEIRQATESAHQAEQTYKAELAQTRAQAETLARQVEANHRTELANLRSDFETKLGTARAEASQQEQKYKTEIAETKSAAETRARQSEERRIADLAQLQADADAKLAAAQAETRQVESRSSREMAQLRAEFELKLGAALVENRKTEDRAKNDLALLTADSERKMREAQEQLRRTEEEHARALVEVRAEAERKAEAAEEKHRNQIFTLSNQAESKLNAVLAEKVRIEENAKAELEAAHAMAANDARQTDERFRTQIASITIEAETKLNAAIADRQRAEENARAERAAARAQSENDARVAEERRMADIAALTQQSDANLGVILQEKQRIEENFKAELAAARIQAEYDARQAEERRHTDLSKLTVEYESKLKNALDEKARLEASATSELLSLQAQLENQIRELNAQHQAELSSIKTDADGRIQLTLAEAWRAEEIYKTEIEQVRLDSINDVQSTKNHFQAEIEQLKSGMQLKLEEAATENNRLRENTQAEIEEIRRDARERIQEAEARAYQAMNETRRTESRFQAKIDEANARAQGALLATETAEKRASEAEVRIRLLEAQLDETDARRREAEQGLVVRAESGPLTDPRASAFEIEFNRNLEMVRARIAKSQTDSSPLEEPIAEAIALPPIELKPASDPGARPSDERYRNKLAEVENKFREMESRIREAETRANRTEEAFKSQVNNLIADVDSDPEDILSLDDDYEKKFEVSDLRARAKYQTLPLIAEDAQNRLSNDILQDIDEDPLGDIEPFSVVDRREQNIQSMRSELASDPYNQKLKVKLNKLLIHQGISLACNNRQPQAIELLLEASELDPSNEMVWLWLASMADSQSKAIDWLKRALEINPNDEKAKAWLENLLLQPQPYLNSVQCPLCGSMLPVEKDRCLGCRAILNLNDIDAILDNLEVDRKTLFTSIERYQGATIASNDYGAHFHLGIAYLNLHQITEAVKHFQIVSNLCPQDDVLKSRVEALKQRQKASVAASEKNRPSINRSRTVMIIDDSAADRKLFVAVLERYGHRIISASGSMEALAKLNDETPDLIFLDISMPGMDGYQLCGFIKSAEATRNVPVIMLSSKGEASDEARGRTVGADGFINKPFEPTDLIETLDNFCSTNPSRRQLSASF